MFIFEFIHSHYQISMNSILIKFLLILLLSIPCFGQNRKDSLKNVLQNEDLSAKQRASAMSKYAAEYFQINLDSTLYYGRKAYDFAEQNSLDSNRIISKNLIAAAYKRKGVLDSAENGFNETIVIAQKLGYIGLEATGLNSIGSIYADKGEFDKALEYYNKSILLLQDHGDKSKMADAINNRAIIYIRKGDYEQATADLEQSIDLYKNSKTPSERTGPMNNLAILKTRQGDYSGAIELYTESLAINEQGGDYHNSGYTLLNIANLYYNQGDFEQFFEFANKSLEVRERLGFKPGILRCLTNLGIVHYENKDLELGIEYLEKALPLAEELNRDRMLARILHNIGSIQVDQGKYELAWQNINHAMRIYNEVGTPSEIAETYGAFGYYYKGVGDKKHAIEYYSKALDLTKDSYISLAKQAALALYQLYEDTGDNKRAFETYKIYVSAKDSIANEENQREIIRQEYKYEYEKQAVADSISFANQEQIQKTKLAQSRNQQLTLLIVLLMVAGFAIILFSRMKLIKKQKTTIEEQNQELNSLNDNLEQKVAQRTQEIVAVNKNLKASDERYTYALEASNDGIWDYNVKEDAISFSPAIYTMLGYEPYEFPETREHIYKLMHDDDVKDEKRKAHLLFTTQNQEDYILDEYRLHHKDGKKIWVQVKGKIVEKDINKKPLRIVGTHTDITADKLKNQEMLEAVLKTEDAERSRISKDIHDGLQQTLTISLLNFQHLKKDLKDLGSKTMEKFDLGWKYLQNSINETRSIAHSLMPKEIVDFGILSVFENNIDVLNRSHEKTTFHFSHNLKTEKLSNQQIEITLYRILQEALNNINKYAKASNVHIQLKEYDDIFMLTIEDDGQGFDLKKESTGLGFKSMRNRLDAINGYLEIDSVIGKGTSILVEISKNNNS